MPATQIGAELMLATMLHIGTATATATVSVHRSDIEFIEIIIGALGKAQKQLIK